MIVKLVHKRGKKHGIIVTWTSPGVWSEYAGGFKDRNSWWANQDIKYGYVCLLGLEISAW